MAKKIQIAADGGSTWYTLPGNTGEFMAEAASVEDTVFGQDYKSEFPDMITWKVSANAIYKGFAGYQVVIKQTGDPVVMTTEAMTLVSGKTYRVTAATKCQFDYATPPTVYDNGVNHTADVQSINYLFGTVTFKSAYTVTGPVTVTGKYVPSSQICAMNKFSLSQNADSVDNTDLCVVQANGGMKQYQLGLKNVSLELSCFYKSTSTFLSVLEARKPIILEINPDGGGATVARGFFVLSSDKESGKVGALEDEAVTAKLYVPDIDLLEAPFQWVLTNSTLNMAIVTLLNAWQSGSQVQVRYLENGVTGKQGNAVPTDVSLAGGMGALNEFTVALTGSGGITAI